MDCKKILIAVDGSENSMRAVTYTASLVRDSPGFTVSLLHIERFPDRDLFPDDETWKKSCAEQTEEMRTFLSDAKDMLLNQKVPEDSIQEHYVMSCKSPFADRAATRCSFGTSIAQEILSVMKENDYGTVVIGRRGVSKAEEFLFGSVSNKIIHYAKGCTIWVVA